VEYVLHGDYDGKVYQQEVGTNFNGNPILSIYRTPYLDFGDTEIRKVIRTVNVFTRAEGPMTLEMSIRYDWGSGDTAQPASYTTVIDGVPAVYNAAGVTYNGPGIIYGGGDPVAFKNVEGSGRSTSFTFVTLEDSEPFSIQGIVFEFTQAGRR